MVVGEEAGLKLGPHCLRRGDRLFTTEVAGPIVE